MNLNELITEFSELGVKLSASGDQLRIRAPKGVLTPERRELLTEHKAQILLLLRQISIGASATSMPVVVPAPEQRYQLFPLTDIQHAYWVGRSGVFELGHVSTHGYYEIEGTGLNLELLNLAWQKLIDRHEMLRTIVLPNGQQQILEEVPVYQISVLDLRGLDNEAVNSQLEAVRQEMSHQVLPSDRWPLFEIRSTRLDGDRVRLHVSYDTLIFDGWSFFLLFEEWAKFYRNPDILLSPLELSFRDYVLAEQALQNTELFKRSQEYWFNRIDSLPGAPELPLAKNPSFLKQSHSKRRSFQLDLKTWEQLKQRAIRAGLTPSGTLLAAFAEVLTVWSKNPRFTLNIALFNRLPLHPQVNEIVGDFTSITLLAVDNSTAETFTNRAIRLQKQLWQDLEHCYFGGVRVMRELARREGRAPGAMPIVFTSTLGFGSLGQEASVFNNFGELVYGISQASQAWMDRQILEQNGVLMFNWDTVEEMSYNVRWWAVPTLQLKQSTKIEKRI